MHTHISHRGTTLYRLVPFPERYSVPESFGFPEFRESGNALPYTEHYTIYCPRPSSATVTILIGLHLLNGPIYYTSGEDLQGTPTSIHLKYHLYVNPNVPYAAPQVSDVVLTLLNVTDVEIAFSTLIHVKSLLIIYIKSIRLYHIKTVANAAPLMTDVVLAVPIVTDVVITFSTR